MYVCIHRRISIVDVRNIIQAATYMRPGAGLYIYIFVQISIYLSICLSIDLSIYIYIYIYIIYMQRRPAHAKLDFN